MPRARSHAARSHAARRPVTRPRRKRADPKCPTCHGTGKFTAIGKAVEIQVHCPRCLGPASIHVVPALAAPMPAMALASDTP